jgi:transcriptional regulator with XRE-family HTH domain
MESFGVLFGRLVREKRGIEGLSQDDLAAKSELAKARISEIETGKVAKPQAKTIDALCVALNISPEELKACYPDTASRLPARLLENLALRFGHDNPNAKEDELEAFLKEKAVEFREMRERLAQMAQAEGRISDLLTAANAALGEGDFKAADDLLGEAERVHLKTTTIAALEKQAELRIERGNAALVSGNVSEASNHFEQAAHYFSGVDPTLEAGKRHEYSELLRYYGYRYRSHEALYAARDALQQNLHIWHQDTYPDEWCKTKNALGGVSWRLSQFDNPENSLSHTIDARKHYEDVREICSEEFLPRHFASAGLNLANVFADRSLAKSDADYETNLQLGLSLQVSALRFFSKSMHPTEWGILQHNLGCSYIRLSNLRGDELKSVNDIENAIHHLELSFQVREPVDSLQYWVASCRSLGEALLNMSTYTITKNAEQYIQRASDVLNGAASKISASEHPNQWAEIQLQLGRVLIKSRSVSNDR